MPEHDADTLAMLKALGVEIRSWRTGRGLTRADLAKLVGISETTMGRIERDGPVDIGDTWRLARALGIELSDLVQRAEGRRRLDVSEAAPSLDAAAKKGDLEEPGEDSI